MGDGGGKVLFCPLKSVKHQKAPSGQSVSTNFVADCWLILSFIFLLALIHNN